MIQEHVLEVINISDQFESQLYSWAVANTKNPAQAIKKIKEMSSPPSSYGASRDEIIQVSLLHKEIDDVVKRIREEALKRAWKEN